MTPFILPQLFLIDVLYMFNTLFIQIFVFIINLMLCNHRKGKVWIDIDEYLDHLFYWLLNMNAMDVKGYRRLRTISQLIFESVP